jgi:hypothetical protein
LTTLKGQRAKLGICGLIRECRTSGLSDDNADKINGLKWKLADQCSQRDNIFSAISLSYQIFTIRLKDSINPYKLTQLAKYHSPSNIVSTFFLGKNCSLPAVFCHY